MYWMTLALLSTTMQDVRYPQTLRSDFVETLHGREIPDPYRWLEDANSDATKAWVKAQNAVTFGYLRALPERKPFADRFAKLYNFPKYGTPLKIGGRYFWTENTGLQNQDVWFWSTSLNGKRKLLIDPNKLSKNGEVALNRIATSWDGEYFAYSLSRGGSDWQEWYVRNVDTGKDLKDKILWSKFSGASWSADNKGFYYSAYDAPEASSALQQQNYFQKLYYHRLGEPQSADKLIYERKDQKEWGFDGSVTEDGKYVVVSVWKGSNRENQIFFMPTKGGRMQELLAGFDAQYSFIGNEGSTFYFYTDKSAPMGKVISIDATHPDKRKTIVAEAKQKLDTVSMVGGKIFANYLRDASTFVSVHALNGKKQSEVRLPGIGAAGGFGGFSNDKETFYSFQSFGFPPTVFRYDIGNGQSSKVFAPKVDFDPNKFETKEIFYKSSDGTRIPMFISYKKGLKLNGKNPTLLYGYGGFNIAMTPFFSPSRVVWMEAGGVSAVACIRGGNEYGNKWNDDGRLFKKKNCFKDFIAGAEWLIAQKYTSTPKLTIEGASNGGLLVGACMTMRPDLFGVCLPEVGVMDMLRFHKFTIGWAWTSDFGSPDDPKMFDYLLSYSPYHNIRPDVKYPPTLIITGDHDDRVVPAHSFKFAAEMQHDTVGDGPVLIRIETQAGHGAGKPTAKIIEEVADKYAFALHNMKAPLPKGFGK